MLIAWLRPRRSRCLLLLCSPLLLPFFCATFPLLCAAELCLRLRRRRSSYKRPSDDSGGRLRRCEEGGGVAEVEEEGGEMGLLHRYLEDQIGLVGSVYECGDDEDLGNHVDVQIFDGRTSLLTS